jgi:DUF1365 family protein
MKSCIYEGQVRHARAVPVLHRFSYRLFMMYLDLDELPQLFDDRWLWSSSHSALARFRREDHLGPNEQALSESVRDLVEQQANVRPAGPIRLLTNLSYFGYGFSPVSFYYCYSEDESRVEFIVAEVNNTPWGEQDTYVMPCTRANKPAGPWRFSPSKKMHVSPFMPMNIDYRWLLSAPDERLRVHMASNKNGERVFNASMRLERHEITGRSLAGILVRFPFMTIKIIAAIHWQALRLWIKRCPLYAHPNKQKEVIAQ